MSLEKKLDLYGRMIEERLEKYLLESVEKAEGYHPSIAGVYSGLRDFMLRKGKRLASCSTLLTYKGYTGEVDERILNVCVGVEAYRHCILVHDDMVDMDALRRGGETMHKMFGEGGCQRLGEGVAVFAGNIAYALAIRAILDSGFPEEKVAGSLLQISKGYQEVNESQILDLLFEYRDVEVEEWCKMASRRAASLFKASLLIGGILGSAPENDLSTLEKAAVKMGYSFDIQDDIIDTYTDEERYGKPPCRDIALGKKPLHVIYALKSSNQESSETLRSLIGKKMLSQREIDSIRGIIKDSGGLDAARKKSKRFAEEAINLINQTGLSEEVKLFFESLTAYVTESLDWYK